MTNIPTNLLRATAAATVVFVAACGPTDYGPASSLSDTGYQTAQVANDRYVVRFEGNEATSRERVETYLLYRVAQVAEQTGHPYFAIVSEETDREIETYFTAPGFYGYGPFRYPYYSTYSYSSVGAPVSTTDSYEAAAAVEMLESRPQGREDVMATQEVLDALRPHIDAS